MGSKNKFDDVEYTHTAYCFAPLKIKRHLKDIAPHVVLLVRTLSAENLIISPNVSSTKIVHYISKTYCRAFNSIRYKESISIYQEWIKLFVIPKIRQWCSHLCDDYCTIDIGKQSPLRLDYNELWRLLEELSQYVHIPLWRKHDRFERIQTSISVSATWISLMMLVDYRKNYVHTIDTNKLFSTCLEALYYALLEQLAFLYLFQTIHA